VFTSETPVGNWYQQGVVLAFEHDGFDVRVPGDIAEIYGRHRTLDRSRRVQARLLVLANDDIVGFHGRPGYRVIGYGGERSLAATVAAGARIRRQQERLQRLHREGRLSLDQMTHRSLDVPKLPHAVLILERTT
jgi:hypothetical protein